MRDLLGVATTFGFGQPVTVSRLESWSPSWSPADAQLLCSLMSAYRLVDVMALVHGSKEVAPNVPRTFLQKHEQTFDVSPVSIVYQCQHLYLSLGDGMPAQLAWPALEAA